MPATPFPPAALAALLGITDATVAERIDPARSGASFAVEMRLPIHARGMFDRVQGELVTEAEGRRRVSVALDARYLHFDGPAWMERVTRADDFLDVAHHPEIRFLSRPFTPELLRQGGELQGQLTLRGQTRDVSFRLEPSTCPRPGRDCDIHVAGQINRRDYGMTSYRLIVRDAVHFDFRVHWLDEPPQ